MALNNFDDDQYNSDMGLIGEPEPEPEPENKPSGKNFLIAIGILGAVLILALALLLLVAPRIIAQQQSNQLEQVAEINAANTGTALAVTNQAIADLATATPQPTSVLPTKTPVVVFATSTPAIQGTLSADELATVHALQTQMAGGGLTTPAPTSTALPNTGFADDFGLPGVFGLAAVLIAVIFISRKLRTAAH